MITPAERKALDALLEVASAAYQAFDNSERTADGGAVIEGDFCKGIDPAFDALDALPDDKPGYTMSPPAKAEFALRHLLTPCPVPWIETVRARGSRPYGVEITKIDGGTIIVQPEGHVSAVEALTISHLLVAALSVGRHATRAEESTRMLKARAPDRPELDALIERAVAWFNGLSAEEQEAHLKAQIESLARGLSPLERETTT